MCYKVYIMVTAASSPRIIRRFACRSSSADTKKTLPNILVLRAAKAVRWYRTMPCGRSCLGCRRIRCSKRLRRQWINATYMWCTPMILPRGKLLVTQVLKRFSDKFRERHVDFDPASLLAEDSFKIAGTSDKRSQAHLSLGSMDGLKASARGQDATDFCKARGVNETASFDLHIYNAETAGIIARAWCHRMQYFFHSYTPGRFWGCLFCRGHSVLHRGR